MKETTKAIIGGIGLITVLGFGIMLRTSGPKATKTETVNPARENAKTNTKETTTTFPNGVKVVTKEVQVETLKIIEFKKNNRVSVDIQCRTLGVLNGTCKDRVYGLGFERRLFDSPVFIGGGMDSKGGVKISTSVEF